MESDKPPTPSRSEVLRKERNTRSQERLNDIAPGRVPRVVPPLKQQPIPRHSVKPGVKAVYPRPVTRSAVLGARPLLHTSRANVRRKVAFSLKSPGAEMVLPALPEFKPGWRILSGLLAGTLSIILMMFSLSSEYRVAGVTFSGIQRVDPVEAAALIDLNNIPVFLVQPLEVQRKLAKAYPELVDISVTVDLPAKVTVTASERQPLISWEYNGQTLWIDGEGVVLSQRGELPADTAAPVLTIHSSEPPPQSVPTENGLPSSEEKVIIDPLQAQKPPKLADNRLIAAAQKLNTMIPAGTTLVYSSQDGLGWSDARGWNVFIGSDLDDLEMKLVEYQSIVDHLTQNGIQPNMISVEHIYAPFYRVE